MRLLQLTDDSLDSADLEVPPGAKFKPTALHGCELARELMCNGGGLRLVR